MGEENIQEITNNDLLMFLLNDCYFDNLTEEQKEYMKNKRIEYRIVGNDYPSLYKKGKPTNIIVQQHKEVFEQAKVMLEDIKKENSEKKELTSGVDKDGELVLTNKIEEKV